jgi:cyclopropane fatty-acyl-phospholipid synthase-like methyltransferase
VDNSRLNAGDHFYIFPGMDNEYYKIKDKCRKGLLKYLAKAFSLIPVSHNPEILDIGCGTGVPSIWLAKNLNATITAIDTDKNALDWLQKKILEENLGNRMTISNISFFDLESKDYCFDIILAEGFLNVVGFEQGFCGLSVMLRQGGHLVIHDEYKDHKKKCDFIDKNGCQLIDTIFLDETVWWNDYYKPLETEINSLKIRRTIDLFITDLKEIEFYKKDPSPFKSIYYLVKKKSI